MGKNTTKQEKAKRNREYAKAHRKPTAPAGRFRRFDRPSAPAPAQPAVSSQQPASPESEPPQA